MQIEVSQDVKNKADVMPESAAEDESFSHIASLNNSALMVDMETVKRIEIEFGF